MTRTFAPPAGGFDDALGRSQRRRRRRHAREATAGGAVLAGVVAVFVAVNPAGLTSLRQDQPAAPISPSPNPTQRPSVSTGSPSLSGGPATSTPTGARPGRPGPLTSSASGGATPRAPGELLISTSLRRTTTSYDALQPCADSTGRSATGWCVQPGSSFTGRTAAANTHEVSLCRLPGALTAPASFPSTLEAAFALHTGGASDTRLWASESQHPGRSERHDVSVSAGQCLTWALTWYGRNDTGRPTPAGRYELVMSVLADNIAQPNTVLKQRYDYTVTAGAGDSSPTAY